MGTRLSLTPHNSLVNPCAMRRLAARVDPTLAIPLASESVFLQQRARAASPPPPPPRPPQAGPVLMEQVSRLGFLVSWLLKGISSSLLHGTFPPCFQVSPAALPQICASHLPSSDAPPQR